MPFGIGRALKKTGGSALGLINGGLFGSSGGRRYPDAPDPHALANEQWRYNQMAPVNQSGPFGSLNYSVGADGRLTANTTLDPAGQAAIGGARQGAGDRLSQFLRQYSGVRPDFSAERDEYESALYGRFASRLDPQYQDRERSLLSRLEAQGITQGSQAYQSALDDFNRERRSAYDEARTSSVLGGGAEQSRMFDMFSQARGQDFGEVGSLFNLGQLGYVPQGVSQIAAPDFMGAANNQYLGQIGAYNNAQQQQAAQQQGLFGLLGTLGGAAIASSRTFKDEIGDAPSILDKLESLPIKLWTYKEHIGPYAEEWAARFGGDGKTINMIDAFGIVLKAVQELTAEVRSLKHGH
jgi:hypothetical protein